MKHGAMKTRKSTPVQEMNGPRHPGVGGNGIPTSQGHLPEKIEASLKMSERREVTGS